MNLSRGMVLATALLALGGGCGGGGPADEDSAGYDAETLVPAIVEAVEAEKYAHLAMGTQNGSSAVDMDVSWEEPAEFRVLVGEEAGEFLEYRKVGGRMYVGGEATDDEWTFLELDDPRIQGADGFDSGVVPNLLAIDVPGDLESLSKAVTEVAEVGKDEVSGVQSTHYELTVDTTAWTAALPEHSIFRETTFDDSTVMDLWIDENALPVRWDYESRREKSRVDYSNWGAPIAVVEPEGATRAE